MNVALRPELSAESLSKPLVLTKRTGTERGRPLGQILVDLGELSTGDMLKAVAMRARQEARLGDILLSNKMVSEDGLYRGLAEQFGCSVADLANDPPDPRLIDMVSPARCLQDGFVPWKRIGAATVVVTCRPETFARQSQTMPAEFGTILMAVAPESQIHQALMKTGRNFLTVRAEQRVDETASCRGWDAGKNARYFGAALIALAALLITNATLTFAVLCMIAIFALVLNTGLKVAAAIATMNASVNQPALFATSRNRDPQMRLPTISILVPLFREKEIAARLVHRLARLNYPRELLDVCLIVEADDKTTKAALRATDLPVWMRRIEVPVGTLKTKPRALNFALDFCRGTIIGVYDAEDAPEPDQLFKVARRFHDAPADIACLQGVLDFYNARANWLSRCFTIEYATWFRVVLPGLEKLGLVLPLGGTTLFFRRSALESIGAWDAHNVTEDADIGVRLARRGFRTELLPSLTEEEANCRIWPWVRQRSRWLKGYAMTWAVHMRAPRDLLRDVGWRKFLGLQLLFGGTLTHFLLAPALWSFWVLPFGLWHPVQEILPRSGILALIVLFILSEITSIGISVYAVATKRHRTLWPWVPSMALYFPLGALAAYKAFFEMASNPFFWDKTQHGVSETSDRSVPRPDEDQGVSIYSLRHPA